MNILTKGGVSAYSLLVLFFLSMTWLSCSGPSMVGGKAITLAYGTNRCISLASTGGIDSMVMRLEREAGRTLNSTYFLGSTVGQNSSVASIEMLGERKVFPSGRQLGQASIPFDNIRNLYMISCGSSDELTVTKNAVAGMTNGKEYLWASTDIETKEAGSIIPVDFSHLTVLLEIVLEGLDEMKLTRPAIYLTFPDDSNPMLDLTTGSIAATKRKEVFEQMKMYGRQGSSLMLPLKGVRRMEVVVSVLEESNGERTRRHFSGHFDIPVNGLEPGMKYSFIAAIEKEGVYFSQLPTVSKRSHYPAVVRIMDRGGVD